MKVNYIPSKLLNSMLNLNRIDKLVGIISSFDMDSTYYYMYCVRNRNFFPSKTSLVIVIVGLQILYIYLQFACRPRHL